jgi:hypothetical protein
MLRPLQVRVLVEEGRANVLVQDRWGNTPLDEARRVGAALVVNYLEQAAVKRREAELAIRAEQQRVLNAGSSSSVSNWRREQQLQQVLRSQEVAELYRLRQVQAQQVRQLSSSILGESPARQFEVTPQQQNGTLSEPEVANPAAAEATAGLMAAQADSSAGVQRSDAVGELLQLAAQAQQALTLKVEEMELDYVENLQHKKELLEQQQQQPVPASSSSSSSSSSEKGTAARGSNRSSSKGSNNVVSAPKLQQPVGQPVRAAPQGVQQ